MQFWGPSLIQATCRGRNGKAGNQLALIVQNARRHTAHAELQLLTVHGLLHLLGMDHAEPDEEREMFALTDRLLAQHRSVGAEG